PRHPSRLQGRPVRPIPLRRGDPELPRRAAARRDPGGGRRLERWPGPPPGRRAVDGGGSRGRHAVSLAVVNIGLSHDGSAEGSLPGDALVCENGEIAWIGSSADVSAEDHETVVDAGGACVVPGFVDSHVHTTFGDYTPRQQTVGFIDSYLHGGTTRMISASEVHVPGRPSSRTGVKALAVAAAHCFADYRPSGVTVH